MSLIINVLKDMASYFQDDVKRINHALKVHSFAAIISEAECQNEKDKIITLLSAILHDIGIKEAERKYQSAAGKYQEMEGPFIAEKILVRNGCEKAIIERVRFLVGHHHSYSVIDGLDFQILVEADFLVNIYEDNMKLNEVRSVYDKYFKTHTGKQLLLDMYLSTATGLDFYPG